MRPERGPEKAFVAQGQAFHRLLQDRFLCGGDGARRRAGGRGLCPAPAQAGGDNR